MEFPGATGRTRAFIDSIPLFFVDYPHHPELWLNLFFGSGCVRSAVSREPVSGIALADDRPVSWRTDPRCGWRAGATYRLLYGRGRWRRVEVTRRWSH